MSETRPNLLSIDRLTRWHLLGAIVMGALGVWITFDAWHEIYLYARRDEEASHIFIVLPVALWLVWVRRMRFRHVRPSGRIIGPFLALLGWVVTSYGFNNRVMYFYHFGALLVVLGCIFSVLGKNVLFRFFPAVAVLMFIMPIPLEIRQRIALPLQAGTARIAQLMLEIMGVTTEVSGNQLSINGVPVTIAEACNGMRMVFPLFLIGYAFGFGLPLKNFVRYSILVMSPLVALACNVLRTLPLIWLYGYGSKSVADAFHESSGWLMLPIAFLLLLAIIKVMKWAMLPVTRYTLASQ
jgi:exosortase